MSKIRLVYKASFDMAQSYKLYFDHLFILFHIVYEYKLMIIGYSTFNYKSNSIKLHYNS